MAESALTQEVKIEDQNGVRWITLDRPESRNGLSLPVVEYLTNVAADAGSDESVGVVVITGAGGSFCSGLDLKSVMSLGPDLDMEQGMANFHRLTLSIRNILKPTLAAIDGPAVGFGANLALACDLRWASDRAELGERFVKIGLMPDGGGTYFLPRIVGLGKAFELIYEGGMIDAPSALELGIVNRVVSHSQFETAVQEYAEKLAQGPPLAYAKAKRALLNNSGDLEAALREEARGQIELLQTADFMEGIAAFMEKRAPNFSGK